MSVKRWRVKWDETEIPDGEYVRAADYDEVLATMGMEIARLRLYIRELEAQRARPVNPEVDKIVDR